MASHNEIASQTVSPSGTIVPPEILPTSEAFKLAMAEFQLHRTIALRAYMDCIDGLRFDRCWMCERITFLQPSGLKGWTCTDCEQDHHHRGAQR